MQTSRRIRVSPCTFPDPRELSATLSRSWTTQRVLLCLLCQLLSLPLPPLLTFRIHLCVLQAPQICISNLLPFHLRFVGSECDECLPRGIIFFLEHFYL